MSERQSAIKGDHSADVTLMAIIRRFERIKTSAQERKRSFLGVKAFRKNPHDATAHPET
ncbi:MAG: hypothetical protein GX172_03675 [Clostridiales bacterium]|nr:hypothetical protein [Clostridiales bacterium]HOB37346.1 hypothetical protein [Candidatus Avimonas sp.]HQD38837.1 hypothetical protein [Candidatus Avimonas sp.]